MLLALIRQYPLTLRFGPLGRPPVSFVAGSLKLVGFWRFEIPFLLPSFSSLLPDKKIASS